MKCVRDLMLIGIGVSGTLIYQRYHKDMYKQIEKLIDKTAKKIDCELEEMM